MKVRYRRLAVNSLIETVFYKGCQIAVGWVFEVEEQDESYLSFLPCMCVVNGKNPVSIKPQKMKNWNAEGCSLIGFPLTASNLLILKFTIESYCLLAASYDS